MNTWSVTPELIVSVVAFTAGLVTAIWHAAMYVGKLTVKVQRHEDRLDQHEDKLREQDDAIHKIDRRMPRY